MDRNEKKRLRAEIAQQLNLSGTRLTDDEATTLKGFIDDYDKAYKGRSETRRSSHTGWSSDGKYTRDEEFTDTFTEDIGIRRDYRYQDDDGQSGESSQVVKDGRGILKFLRGDR